MASVNLNIGDELIERIAERAAELVAGGQTRGSGR